jgi:hypothetical protein
MMRLFITTCEATKPLYPKVVADLIRGVRRKKRKRRRRKKILEVVNVNSGL